MELTNLRTYRKDQQVKKCSLSHCELIMVALQFVIIVTTYRTLYRIYIFIGSQQQGQLSKKKYTIFDKRTSSYQAELFSYHNFVIRLKTHLKIFLNALILPFLLIIVLLPITL